MNRFIVGDSKRCIGCGTCEIACSNAHKEVGLQTAPRLSVIETLRISAITACHHCEGAPCARVCPEHVIHHEHGMIRIEEKDCIGCKLCALVCPFGAIHPAGTSTAGVAGIKVATPTFSEAMSDIMAWEIGVHTVAVKCDLCYFDHQGPNCVRVCPTRAITIMNEQEMDAQLQAKRMGQAHHHARVMDALNQAQSMQQSADKHQAQQDMQPVGGVSA